MVLTSHIHPTDPRDWRRRQALDLILAELGDRLAAISPTDYRALRAESPKLPSPAAIWDMFGGFHRMRECAAMIDRN